MVTKKKTKFFKSLRFRIFIILIILGIVPGIIVTQLMIHYYENQAVEVSVSAVRTECAILCDQIIKENAEKAGYVANKTLRKVQKKVGFPERIR